MTCYLEAHHKGGRNQPFSLFSVIYSFPSAYIMTAHTERESENQPSTRRVRVDDLSRRLATMRARLHVIGAMLARELERRQLGAA